jgi:hypothetical protein
MEKLIRRPQGDRPELVFPPQRKDQEPYYIPQTVGFTNSFGAEIGMSVMMAERMGLIAVGSIAICRMPIADYIELQRVKREQKIPK